MVLYKKKITDAFGAKTIPIYYGNPNVVNKFNPKSFINCHAFRDMSEMVDYVKKIDQNDDLYINMMREPICDSRFTSAYYLKCLEAFLIKIVEKGTVQREKELWAMWLESERVYGRKKRLADEKKAIMLGKTFKLFRKTQVAKNLRRRLLWTSK